MGIISSLFGCKKSSVVSPSESNAKAYQFAEPATTACFTCRHVVKEGADILHVTHDGDDGSWQFLCGQDHSEEDAMILGLGEVVEIDPSVNGLYEMPAGVGAYRDNRKSEWKPFKLQ